VCPGRVVPESDLRETYKYTFLPTSFVFCYILHNIRTCCNQQPSALTANRPDDFLYIRVGLAASDLNRWSDGRIGGVLVVFLPATPRKILASIKVLLTIRSVDSLVDIRP
jgi:hypothetical protein